MAIIAILAAALFPSLVSYLAGSRDTGRITDIRNIRLAATTYFTNNNNYNGIVTSSFCVSPSALAIYMGNKVPSDDPSYEHAGCSGDFGAATGKLNVTPALALFAQLETEGKGNTGSISNMSALSGQNLIYIQSLKMGGNSSGYLDI